MPVRPAIHRPHPRRSATQERKAQDAVRKKESPWRRWYWTARWRSIAKQQMVLEPLCRMCAQAGRVTAASICDHVQPHRGDENLFWYGERQSLCKTCHDGAKQSIERGGRRRGPIGLDGYPIADAIRSQPVKC